MLLLTVPLEECTLEWYPPLQLCQSRLLQDSTAKNPEVHPARLSQMRYMPPLSFECFG